MRKIITSQGFDPQVFRALRKLSTETSAPVQEIIRRAVDMYLETIEAADAIVLVEGNLETPAILKEAGK